jgi:lactoylglutathione lyase
MKIEHIAIWVKELEKMKEFYEKYFGATSNAKYHNPHKNFQSYFLSFQNGCRLELMHNPDIDGDIKNNGKQKLGIIHFAVSVTTKEKIGRASCRERVFQEV